MECVETVRGLDMAIAAVVGELVKQGSNSIGSAISARKDRQAREKQFKRQQDEIERQNSWERKWGDILNAQSRTTNAQTIRSASRQMKTDRLENKLREQQLNQQANSMKSFTIGNIMARKNLNRAKQGDM